MKKLLRYTFLTAAIALLPAFGQAADADAWAAVGVVDIAASDVQISLTASTLRIVGAQGQTVEIFNVTGVKVFSRHIDAADQTFQHTLPRGCYLVKVGNTVRKVNIR